MSSNTLDLSYYDYDTLGEVPPRTSYSDDFYTSYDFREADNLYNNYFNSNTKQMGPLETTHNSDYLWKIPYVQPTKFKDKYIPSSEPFQGETTHKATYQPNYANYTAKSFRRNSYINMENIPFYDETTNDAEYTYKESSPVENSKPLLWESYTPDHVPFYAETTHKSDFVPKEVVRTTNTSWGRASNFQPAMPSSIKFDDTTTNKVEYGVKEVKSVLINVPKQNVQIPSDIKLDDQTTNKLTFTPKVIEKTKPFRYATNFSNSSEPFDGTTTNMETFTPKQIEKDKSSKSTSYFTKSEEPFDGNTTHQTHFQPIEGQRPQVIKRAQTLGNDGRKLESLTTHQEFFQAFKLETPKKVRPPLQTYAPTGEFDGKTTNQESYQTPTIERTQRILKIPATLQLSGEFDGTTTHKSSYQPTMAEKRRSLKKLAVLKNDGNFEDKTTHKLDYTAKQVKREKQTKYEDHEIFEKTSEKKKTEMADSYQQKEISKCPAEAFHPKRSDARRVGGHYFFSRKKSIVI